MLGAALLVAALVGAAGGFADVPVQKVPPIEIGERYDGVELDVTVERIYSTALRPGSDLQAPDGSRYLVVEAELLNTTTSPTFLGRDSVRLIADGVVAVKNEPDLFVDVSRGANLTFLQPELPTRAAYAWEVADDAPLPPDVVVGVLEQYRVSDNPIFDDAYGPLTAVARVLAPLDPLPERQP